MAAPRPKRSGRAGRPRQVLLVANDDFRVRRIPKAARLRVLVHKLCFRVTGCHREWLILAPNETAALTHVAQLLGFRGLMDAGPAWLAEFQVRLDHATPAIPLPRKLAPPAPPPGGIPCPWCGTAVHD